MINYQSLLLEQEEEYKDAERARLEEAERVRQEQVAHANRPTPLTNFNFYNSTSTPVRGEPNRTPTPETGFQTGNQNRQTDRGINFNLLPTRHIYTTTGTTNSSDGYEQFTNDSIIQSAEMNNRKQTTTTNTSGTNHTMDWQMSQHTNDTQPMTTTTGSTALFGDSPTFPNERNSPTCYRYSEQGHIHTGCDATGIYCNHC